MKIFILAQFMGDISKPNSQNSRFFTVADLLLDKGHEVNIITTDFVHNLKSHICSADKYKGCEIVLLHEPGYPKNVCLKRVHSHKVLAKNLSNYLSTCEKPDVIYCAIPSLDFAYEAATFAKNNNIRFILDIQDLWPEAFEMVIPSKLVNRILFDSWRKKANSIYASADNLIAVSDTYLNRALSVNTEYKSSLTVYLGTSLDKFDSFRNESINLEKNDEIWLGYVGTLGHSYDLKTVFDALNILKDRADSKKVRMIVIGDGPLRREFEAYACERNLNVTFTGSLPYPQMVATLCKCDIAVNPIKKNSAGSIINKHADYAAAGIPVINTQESPEYRKLVEDYKMGFNCECEDSADFAKKLVSLTSDTELRRRMGIQARKCAEEKFDRNVTYKAIVDLILNCDT